MAAPLLTPIYGAAGLADVVEVVLLIADFRNPLRGVPDDSPRRRVVGPTHKPPVAIVAGAAIGGGGHQVVVGVAFVEQGRGLNGCAVGLDPRRPPVSAVGIGAPAVAEPSWLLRVARDEVQVVVVGILGSHWRRCPGEEKLMSGEAGASLVWNM